MKKDRMYMSLLFPFLAVVTIATFAGGLGVIFMVINETAVGEWGVVILGMALVVGVPGVAALAQTIVEKS